MVSSSLLRSVLIRNVNRKSFFIRQILTSFSTRLRLKKSLTAADIVCHAMSCMARLNGDAMKKHSRAFWSNRIVARAIWGELSSTALHSLKDLITTHGVSVAAGDLQLLEGRWYVTHGGLLRISERRRCSGIRTTVERELSDPTVGRWVFKAIVYKSPRSRGFVGYGDADPSNVSSLVHGAEMRVAETRAVNREAGQFAPHSGIRFPQNGCLSCAQLGLCLGNQPLIDAKLIHRPGASDLDWLDSFDD
jgi:hypothetical protein